MKNIKRPLVIFFVLTAVALPFVSQAAVSQLVFTTEPQTIVPGTSSEIITIQTRNNSGEKENITETADVNFVSSSPTGEFSSSNTNWQSVTKLTMRVDSANRNFYYRDSLAGTPTLTVTVTGRVGGTVWSASQTITVGSGASTTGGDGNTNNSNSATTSMTITGGSSSGPLSAHASPAPVSSVAPSEPFRVGAGRPRLVSVHSPVLFRAESVGTVLSEVRYQWSFGDGGSAVGEQVNHVYYFPGEYNIVLNAVELSSTGLGGKTAVGRTTISVIQPVVSLGSVSTDRVEITNRSARELNLGGWRIIQGTTAFTFPADTIVATGKSTLVPSAYLGFSPVSTFPLTLTFPDATVAFAAAPAPSKESLEAMALSLRQLSAKLLAIKTSRLKNIQTVQPTPIVTTIPSTTTSTLALPTGGEGGPPLSASVATIPVPKPPGFFARMKSWFGK